MIFVSKISQVSDAIGKWARVEMRLLVVVVASLIPFSLIGQNASQSNAKAQSLKQPKANATPTKDGKDLTNNAAAPATQSAGVPTGMLDVDRQILRIVYSGASLRDLSESRTVQEHQTQFTKMCKNLGNALKVGSGPWGMGAFSEFKCERKRSVEPDPSSKLDWVLELKPEESKQITLRLVRMRPVNSKDKTNKPTLYNEIKLPVHPKFMEALSNPELADFIAHALLGSMPIALFLPSYSLMEHASVDYQRKIYRGRPWASDSKFIQPSPFEKMILYRVYFDPEKNLYQAKPAGSMQFNGFESQRLDDGKSTVSLVPVWNLDDASLKNLKFAGYLWGQREKSSKSGQKRLNRLVVRVYRYLTEGDIKFVKGILTRPEGMQEDEQGMLDRVKNLDVELPGGYAGFRYGISMVRKEKSPLLAKTSFIGVLVSVKAGALDGFSLFADISPRVTYLDAGDNLQTIQWQRIVLGYSFDFQIYDFRFDLTPKIGQWNFSADLLPEGADPLEEGLYAMRLDNSLAFGYELGVELRVPLVSARAWIGQDGGIAVANKYTGSSVRSFRGGIDAFYTLGELFTVGTRELGAAIVGFTFFDWITISSKQAGLNAEGEPTSLAEVGYISSFVGGGVSLSW